MLFQLNLMNKTLKLFVYASNMSSENESEMKVFSKLFSFNLEDVGFWNRIKELLGSWKWSWTFPHSFQSWRSAAMQSKSPQANYWRGQAKYHLPGSISSHTLADAHSHTLTRKQSTAHCSDFCIPGNFKGRREAE